MEDSNIKEFGEHFQSSDGLTTSILSDEEKEHYLNNWYTNKKYLGEDDKFITYVSVNDGWDEEEQEHFWLTITLIRVGKDSNTIMTKEITSKPTFNVRDDKLSNDQEIMVRSWVGTDRNPKSGKYLGVNELGLAMIKSPFTGNVLYYNKDGNPTDEKGIVQTFEKKMRYLNHFK